MRKFLSLSIAFVLALIVVLSIPVAKVSAAGVVYVNQYMDTTTSRFQMYAANTGSTDKKADGFVFTYKNEVFVLDGGVSGTDAGTTYKFLYNYRKSLLPSGVSVTNTNYKLKINIIVSHFHSDHVNALINNIIPSGYFKVVSAYYPKISGFRSTTYYSDPDFCDQSKYSDGSGTTTRGKFFSALRTYAPDVYENRCAVKFGERKRITTSDGLVTFDMYGAPQDWGSASSVASLISNYYTNADGSYADNIAEALPVCIVNSNSMWLKVSYSGRSLLFTGDTMKKVTLEYKRSSPKFAAEPFDLMLEYYQNRYGSNEFNVDVVKYVHHGEGRVKAMKGILYEMSPELIIFTTPGTISAFDSSYWDNFTGVDESGNMNYGCYCDPYDSGIYIRIYASGSLKVTTDKWTTTHIVFTPEGNRNYGVYGSLN